MTAYNKIMDQLSSTDLFRKVELEEVQVRGETVPNKKAVIYSDTGEIINVVGKNYRPIQNEEVFSKFVKVLFDDALQLDKSDMTAKATIQGGRSLVSFIFPAHEIALSPRDKTQLQIVVRNSHDGSWKFQSDVGGFRIACANGQVYGNYINAYKSMHTVGFSVNQALKSLQNSANAFSEMGEYWMRLSRREVTEEEAMNTFLAYLNKTFKDEEKKVAYLESSRASTLQELKKSYIAYSNELGRNAYAVYNTLTDHATHQPRPDYVYRQNNQVVKAMDSLPMAA